MCITENCDGKPHARGLCKRCVDKGRLRSGAVVANRKPPALPGWMELVGRILRGIPRFGGVAACSQVEATLFDGESAEDVAMALSICDTCQVKTECAEWLASQPRSARPRGVIGGVYRKTTGDNAA